MNPSRTVRRLFLAAATALLALALLAPAGRAAQAPLLIDTAQYKALVSFVDKLESLSGTPATAAQKASYEDRLENKHEAAVDKASALFNRARRAAKVKSERAIRAGVRTIRDTEAGELAALRRGYDARLDRAAADYEAAVGRVEDVFDARQAALKRQVRRLRKQKAEAKDAASKVLIQAAIDRRLRRASENRKLQAEELADLKAGYRREKAAIEAGKRSAARSVQQNDAEAITTLRNRGRRIYNAAVRTLQSRRVNQLHDLEAKLNRGRAAIARMPAAG